MKKNSFVEGTMIATISIILVKLLGMLYVIPFYKIVGSQGGALYSYAYVIYLLFLNISSAGLPNAISKIISEYDTLGYHNTKNRAFFLARKVLMFISIITFLVLFVFAEEIGMFIIGDLTGGNTYQDVAFVIRCVSPAILIVPFLSITKGYLQGHKIVGPSSISQIIEQVVRILIILCGSYFVMNMMHGTLTVAVGVATASAGISALVAYIYLKSKFRKENLLDPNIAKKKEEEEITNKMVIKKIVSYAVPFIIISIVTDIYNFTDQILVLRTISNMGYSTQDVEFIASAISTWSPKICMTINALAMGMSVPLIPAIVSAYTKNDKKEVNDNINRSIALVFFLSLPVSFGIATLAQPVWNIFYNANPYGGMILRLAVISALCANVYMIISIILQSLGKYKLVYIVSISGFLLNALFDIPWMLFMNKIGFEGFLGSIISSILGFTISVLIGLYGLRKLDKDIHFGKLFNWFIKTLTCGICMVIPLIILNNLLIVDVTRVGGAILKIILYVLIAAPIYIFVASKFKLFSELLGEETTNKLLRKISFGKLGK
ncbi:MAG: polysaccharide biosynthesis protein [Bacilli bacterium]|nr:polysaccharide biosynthesis protein [Bacilli bacterium]